MKGKRQERLQLLKNQVEQFCCQPLNQYTVESLGQEKGNHNPISIATKGYMCCDSTDVLCFYRVAVLIVGYLATSEWLHSYFRVTVLVLHLL